MGSSSGRAGKQAERSLGIKPNAWRILEEILQRHAAATDQQGFGLGETFAKYGQTQGFTAASRLDFQGPNTVWPRHDKIHFGIAMTPVMDGIRQRRKMTSDSWEFVCENVSAREQAGVGLTGERESGGRVRRGDGFEVERLVLIILITEGLNVGGKQALYGLNVLLIMPPTSN